MSRPYSLREERFHELAAARALGDLSPEERHELAALTMELGSAEVAAYEIAAAALTVGVTGLGGEPLPAHLAAAIEEEAMLLAPTTLRISAPRAVGSANPAPASTPAPSAPGAFPSTLSSAPSPLGAAPSPLGAAPSNVVPLKPRPKASATTIAIVASGWITAAACVLLAFAAWQWKKPVEVGVVPPPSSSPVTTAPPIPSAPPSDASLREALLARGASKLEWAATKDPASTSAAGDVVWSAAEQKGYMRFRGLAKNDPRGSQYQLWIFDKDRDQRYPVDGGVFDVTADGDVLVPIKARLPVGEAVLFAVTVEKPGGVVVSKRERIVLTAKPAT
ncbi:MAG: anti-sigma factor [Myxococcales bacterium]|jgi:hypothetical protein|nr:anti-sigma factor [Myxococcales bacterium]